MLNTLRTKINKDNYQKIFTLLKNSGWIFFDKIFRMSTGLFVGIWIARYLGPEKFGIMNYILVFPLLFSSVAGLGLTNILFNEFIIEKSILTIKKLFGTSILIKLISGSFCLILAVLASIIVDKDTLLIVLVSIAGVSLVTQSLDVVDTYFQSQRKVQYSIIPKLVVFMLTTGLRIVGLQAKYDIIFFVIVNTIEMVISSLASLIICIKYVKIRLTDFHINITIVKDLLKRSWPLMLSELFLFLYVRVDFLMIKHLSTNTELGNYSVAMRITDLWYFIPIALTASLYPSIIALRQSDYKEYLNRYRQMLSAFALISISIGVLLTLMANPIIAFLYGDKYSGVGSILTINVWTGLFVFLAIGISNWFITESLQKLVLQRTMIGAVINVVLNFILIPRLGAIGASIATLVAQFCVTYVMNGLYSKTREVFTLQTNAIIFLPKFLGSLLRKAFNYWSVT